MLNNLLIGTNGLVSPNKSVGVSDLVSPRSLHTSLSKVLGSDRGPGLDARTETAVLGSLKTVVLGKHLDKL